MDDEDVYVLPERSELEIFIDEQKQRMSRSSGIRAKLILGEPMLDGCRVKLEVEELTKDEGF